MASKKELRQKHTEYMRRYRANQKHRDQLALRVLKNSHEGSRWKAQADAGKSATKV